MTHEDALDALLAFKPRDLTAPIGVQNGSQQRPLDKLFEQCRAAGLTSVAGESDIDRLHALFDVLWEHGMSMVICDFVGDVCSDPSMSSAEAVQSHMQDGRCVADWARAALQLLRSRVHQVLRQGLRAAEADDSLHAEARRAGGVSTVLRALSQPHSSAEPSDLLHVIRIQQLLQVAEWLQAHGLLPERESGRYSSEQAWRSSLNKRRDASAPQPLFLARLLQQLEALGCEVSYPPSSASSMLAAVFLSGSCAPAAFRFKLAAVQYWLLDAGIPAVCAALSSGMGVPAVSVTQWRAAFLLDEAAWEADAPLAGALQEAAALLPGIGSPELPFDFVRVLAERGAPAAALAVQQARGCAAGSWCTGEQALDEAHTLMHIRLHCGLLTQAFSEMHEYLAALPAAVRAQHVRTLICSLALWAESASSWQPVLELPFSPTEEAALVAWLSDGENACSGAVLAALHLQRGRIAESLLAHQLQSAESNGVGAVGGPSTEGRELVEGIMDAAARYLAPAQRLLHVHHNVEGAPLLQLPSADESQGGGVAVLGSEGSTAVGGLLALHTWGAGSQAPPLLAGSLLPLEAAAPSTQRPAVTGGEALRHKSVGKALPQPGETAWRNWPAAKEAADASGDLSAAEGTWQAGPGRQDAFGTLAGAKPATAKKRRVKRARLVSSLAT